LLVYPAGLGLTGSAAANAIAQTFGGLLFVRAILAERIPLRPIPRVIGRQLVGARDLLLRGIALQTCFLSAAAVAARFGTAALAAHQVALQVWMLCALALDALAIAAQSLVGAALGGARAAEARWLARRIAVLGAAAGVGLAALMVGLAPLLPAMFGLDSQVYAEALRAWPWLVAMQPLGGVVFALDGVLIGAGDVAYLRTLSLLAAGVAFLPAVWFALLAEWGLGGVWAALTLFIVVRLLALLARIRSGQWAVVGAAR
jgi:putative MATE family efflux protein